MFLPILICGVQGSTSGVIPHEHYLPLLVRQWLSLWPRDHQLGYTSLPARPRDPLVISASLVLVLGYKGMHHAGLFNMGSRKETQVLLPSWKTFYSLSHLPSPMMPTFKQETNCIRCTKGGKIEKSGIQRIFP